MAGCVVRLVAGLASAGVLVACVEPPPPLTEPAELDHELVEVEIPEAASASVARRAQEITVRIRSLGCEQFGVGSGFVLPGGIVATNRHVIEQPLEVTVNTWDGRTLPASVSGVAVDSDLALLQLSDGLDLPVAEFRTEPVEVGEAVLAVGYPGGGPATISTGKVIGLADGEVLGEPADVIRVDAEIRQGNSGGPLLDEQGRVVGVVFALEVGSGNGLAVPIQTLLDRLDGAVLAPSTGDC